jgi:hypothetical protein
MDTWRAAYRGIFGFKFGGAWIREVAYGWKELGALLWRVGTSPPSAR